MADDIEQLEAELRDAMRRTDEDLLFAVTQVAPELLRRSFADPPPSLRARPTIADYDHDLDLLRDSGHDVFGHLRDLVLIGIRVGSISVEDVYRRVRPAMIALTVLLDPGAGPTAPALARRIRRGMGRGAGRWAEAIAAVDAWPGSLRSLLKRERRSGDDFSVHDLVGPDEHLWRGANILLALAPSETLPRIAAEAAPIAVTGHILGEAQAVRNARVLVRIAGHAPLSRAVVDYALNPRASARVRMVLAANPLTPNTILNKLLAFADSEPGVAVAISTHDCAPPAIRLAAFGKVPDPEGLAQARQSLQRDIDTVRRVQRIATISADEADLAYALIRDAGPELPIEARLFAYAHLARISGLEAVWALEMDRAGLLEKMHPVVRASMAAGSAVPLLEAAVANPYRGMHQDTVTSVAELRREDALDCPFPWQDSEAEVPT